VNKKAILVLENGSIFEGYSFGADIETYGEVVFNTSMTGYQEILTDPSYAGQIVVPTYPMTGNYGINDNDFESKRIQVSGFVVREECEEPSHYQSKMTIHEYLAENGIAGIHGIDTRAITRLLRSCGVMRGIITCEKTPQQALAEIKMKPDYSNTDFVQKVSSPVSYDWQAEKYNESVYNIAVLDCGLKFSILRKLSALNCSLKVFSCDTPAVEILKMNPDGVLLSPGPGNPELLGYIVDNVKILAEKKPIMGICLGNQLIGRAFGAKTFKLKFGHRGGNHPVKELANDRIHITAQNHGFALDPDTVSNGLEVSFINLNDGTVEGVRHKELPIFGIQYHSEASPGPLDTTYLFKQFLGMIDKSK